METTLNNTLKRKGNNKCEWIENIIPQLEALNWSVNYDDSNENTNIELQQYSPCGQDFYICLDAKDKNELQIAAQEYYEAYDPEEETTLWYKANRGEPKSLRTLLEDMEWCKKQLDILQQSLAC